MGFNQVIQQIIWWHETNSNTMTQKISAASPQGHRWIDHGFWWSNLVKTRSNVRSSHYIQSAGLPACFVDVLVLHV